jgi:hypothetical protein
MLPGCIVFHPDITYVTVTIDCSSYGSTHRQKGKNTWGVMLTCGQLTRATWKALIHSGAKKLEYTQGRDAEASHLCGNKGCHLVAEFHRDNMRRSACHRADTCACRQYPRCEVGAARTRSIPDHDGAWKTALRASQALEQHFALQTKTFGQQSQQSSPLTLQRIAATTSECMPATQLRKALMTPHVSRYILERSPAATLVQSHQSAKQMKNLCRRRWSASSLD